MFEVMKERCNECLYGSDKIVSNRRRSEILRELDAKDSYFICHKASILDRRVACRGDWEQRGCGQLGRIAGILGAVREVEECSLTRSERATGE